MIKITTLLTAAFGLSGLMAQTWKSDSVTMGSGYQNQVFYKMGGTGPAGSSKVSNWDIAHNTNSRDNALRMNHMNGLELYNYRKGDNSAWASFDTTGAYAWMPLYNSNHKMNIGAFNQSFDKSNVWDFSWGVYNSGTHTVVGDSLYLILQKDQAGAIVKAYKFMPISQPPNGDFIFKLADVDGKNEVTDTLKQADGNGQNFKYFSFSKNKPVREPAIADWDITFTRYYAPVFDGQNWVMFPYTGVESNSATRVAKVFGKTSANRSAEMDRITFNYYPKLTDSLTAIGADWKSFNRGTNKFELDNKQLFMVESRLPNDSAYYLLEFTGFEGTASGKVVFNTYKLKNTVSVSNLQLGELSLYPNPASDFALITLKNTKVNNARLSIVDMQGKLIMSETINPKGLFAYRINTADLKAGVYQVNISSASSSLSQKLIVN